MKWNLLFRPAAAVAAALLSALVFVAIAGGSPAGAAHALLLGAAGDRYSIADTLARATPLLVSGLAMALAFRAGAINIGAEGQIIAGAAAGVLAGLQCESLPAWLAIPFVMIAAAAGGALVAGFAAALRYYRNVPEVLSTILINFLMLEFVSWLVRGPMKERSNANPQSDPMAASAMLPRVLEGTSLHAGLFIALAAAPAVWFYLFRTSAGFRLRATGENARAARFAGFATERIVVITFLQSGALAGLTGGLLAAGSTGRLYANISGGIGYVAIAVALLGKLHPFGIALAALFFGALDSGAAEMQRTAGVSYALALVVEAASVLTVLALDHAARARRAAPVES